ncbi:acyltransferase [Aggregicoccus sp. 17bor-14]|uniref:acyltransferase family protein n=1 Tax=Myxococcaceae TaxID=31 RepID=UPI00129CB420|nr:MULTISPECIES: acyltransferase [Myxococcaceae]MBF5045589.1 acyltransferase [Simulacricoccus sp. 17bor-14]MRI91326.1 acyltransferase [Aggregicoccus sp. 17bor-14]
MSLPASAPQLPDAPPASAPGALTPASQGQAAPPAVAVRGGRLEFLDALRGIAAMLVAVQHSVEIVSPRYLRWSVEVWRPGEFGVVLFFLCSGFIIPASLEKYHSLKRFWVGRAFRLFPLYWACIAIIWALHAVLGRPGLYEKIVQHPLRETLVNMTMVQYLLNRPLIIGGSWTLAYEMVFYMLCSLLFLAGAHKKTVPLTFLMLCAAPAAGYLVPTLVFMKGTRTGALLATTAFTALALAGLCMWTAKQDRGTRLSIALLSGTLVALIFNRWHPGYFTFSLLATMFVGSLLYRYMKGEVSPRLAWGLFAFGLVAIFTAQFLYTPDEVQEIYAHAFHTWRPEVATFLSAHLVFAAGLALRKYAFPRVITFLGTISYSVYLMHDVVIHVVPQVGGRVTTVAVWLALTVAFSAVTYYAVEKPFQKWGHRLAQKGLAPRPREQATAAS